jgi:hypothetical protein
MAFLAAILIIGILRFAAYHVAIDAVDAIRSAVIGPPSRLPVEAERTSPMLIREGARTIVPEASPLRGKLTISMVGQQEIRRKLVLPAVVKADPSRTVKVLPR